MPTGQVHEMQSPTQWFCGKLIPLFSHVHFLFHHNCHFYLQADHKYMEENSRHAEINNYLYLLQLDIIIDFDCATDKKKIFLMVKSFHGIYFVDRKIICF